MQVTRDMLRQIGADVEKALADVGAKYGVELRYGGASFTGVSFTLKVEGAVPGESKYSGLWRSSAHKLGLPVDMLGKPIRIRGRDYTVAGMTPGGKVVIDNGGARQHLVDTFEFMDAVRLQKAAATTA